MQNEAAIELLKRMQGLLKITTKPPYYASIYDFRAAVREKMDYIVKAEQIKNAPPKVGHKIKSTLN